MKQVLTHEDINFLEELLNNSTHGPWSIVEDKFVDTAWVTPDLESNPVALFDYRTGKQNSADAQFVASARNYMGVMLEEIKTLRKRVLELIQSNNIEVQKRTDLQTELDELKKIIRDINGDT